MHKLVRWTDISDKTWREMHFLFKAIFYLALKITRAGNTVAAY